jgi:isopenicillin-N epimerase
MAIAATLGWLLPTRADCVSQNPYASLWTLDPAVTYLNHGSFGACPRAVLEVQAGLRARMEREPMDFLVRDLPALTAQARAETARFLGADPADLAFLANATAGINAVLRSLPFGPGDELLTTSHVYAACLKTLRYVAARSGARVVVAPVPFPLAGEDEIVAPLLAAVTPRTRLALIDHVSSPTALVFPVQRLVGELQARGVDVLVDGAHAPGMVPLALDAIGAAYSVGNAHKWLCAPKGAAYLHVRRDRQAAIHPGVISHGHEPDQPGARFLDEFDWTGTSDPTAWLSIPACLRQLGALLDGGWPALMARNRELALAARDLLCESLRLPLPAPASMIGSIASVPLPLAAADSPVARLGHEALMGWFRARGVETWFYPWPCAGGKLIRVSAQLYNELPDYRRLAGLLREAMGG